MFKMTKEMFELVRLQRTWAGSRPDDQIPKKYTRSCVDDFNSIFNVLPAACPEVKVLDIGCGLGGINLLLNIHYTKKGVDPEFYALDKNGVPDNIRYGYSHTPSNYNHLALTRQLFELNGIKNAKMTETYPENMQFNLILSLISCGFHYPIDVYMGDILNSINDDSVVIMDIRKHSGQIEPLKNVFTRIECVFEAERYRRMVFRL